MVGVRLRVAGGQVQTDWMRVEYIRQRDGRCVAHARVQGGDFRPPVELGTEILVDIEDLTVAPLDAKDARILDLRRKIAERQR